jgi:anti-sigma regulatory factor (Ser/Thr protein kinase)
VASRPNAEAFRKFLLDNVQQHPSALAQLAATYFKVSRQTALSHIARLVREGQLQATGQTRDRKYTLVVHEARQVFDLAETRDEEKVWRDFVSKHLEGLPENVLLICYHGFTEMFNNVIDHSESDGVFVKIEQSAKNVSIHIKDEGVGIFEKIKSRFGLDDHRQAILELAKGKLTTDPKNHSGEGIYFTSRMFDDFVILSGTLGFCHIMNEEDWLIEDKGEVFMGTTVFMTIATDSKRTTVEIYDKHISDVDGNEFAFARTHVPLKLATSSGDSLVSRSQAKRVLKRFDRFTEVLLDFSGVESIGQGFADEIFRVFRQANPQISVRYINANENVARMIAHVTAQQEPLGL